MDYRAPQAGLERKLGDLEEELARLRVLPPAGQKGPSRKSKEERALEKRLAKLEKSLATAGHRELTPRETTVLGRMSQMGVVLVVCGLAIASLHLVLRSTRSMTWREETCSIYEEEEDYHFARYVSRGVQRKFKAFGETGSVVACWVPEPPENGVGRLTRPPSSRVSLWEKLSGAWLTTAAIAVFLGVVCIGAAFHDARKRRRNVIAADHFPPSD